MPPTVLIVIDHYLPGYRAGGPTRTTANLAEWLGGGINFLILTKDRDYGDPTPYPNTIYQTWNQVGKAQVRYLAPEELTISSLLKIMRDTPHDLIYLNSTFSTRTVVVLLLAWLRLVDQPIILAARGSLSAGALGIKSPKKRLYLAFARLIRLYERVYWHSTGDEETRDIQTIFGHREKLSITQIPNLPMPINITAKNTRSKKCGIARIVMVSRISRMKNLEFMATVLTDVQGGVILDFYGPIEDESYWESCLGKFRLLSSNVVVSHRGSVSPDRVTDLLSQYDLFFMPSLSENFGHAILEALCAGCPVLISDRTPWNDVNECGAGWALPLEEPDRFRSIIQEMVVADAETWRAYSERASAYGADYIAKSSAVEDMRRFLMELASRVNR